MGAEDQGLDGFDLSQLRVLEGLDVVQDVVLPVERIHCLAHVAYELLFVS